MARRPRLLAPGVLYHVIVRGNHSQKTFLSEGDYQAYLERLGRYRNRLGVAVYAYCLMPNHVYLLVETGSQPLSRFMQGLQQSYTQYFNRKHRKVGHLFQRMRSSKSGQFTFREVKSSVNLRMWLNDCACFARLLR